MTRFFQLPLDEVQGPSCYVDGEAGKWFVAGPKASLPGAASCEPGHPSVKPQGPTAGSRAPEAPRSLRHLWLYTNTDCNLSCSHCLLPEHGTHPPLEHLLDRIDQALPLGATTIFLTGGEPFVRPDLASLIAATAPRAKTVVLSNGTLVDAERLRELDSLGATGWKQNVSFQVSLDGDRQVHDRIRGAGTFDRATAGIRNLIAWGRPPAIAAAVTRENIDSVERVVSLIAAMGLKVLHLFLPHQTGRLVADPRGVPDPSELLDAIRRCRDVAASENVLIDNDAAFVARVRNPGRRFRSCHGGHEMLAVGADGHVYPCPSLVGTGSIGCTSGLEDAFDNPRLAPFRDCGVDRRDGCDRCPVRFLCGGGCAAYSYWAGRDFEAPEPYCKVYRGLIEDHLRRESLRLLERAGSLGPSDILWPDGSTNETTGRDARFDCA